MLRRASKNRLCLKAATESLLRVTKMPILIDELRDEHRQMSAVLDVLEGEIREIDRAGNIDLDLLQLLMRYFCQFPDEIHHQKEDFVYAKLKKTSAQSKAIHLRDQHEKLEYQSKQFARYVDLIGLDFEIERAQICKTGWDFIDLSRRHMEMEEKLFFPEAHERLTARDWENAAREAEQTFSKKDQQTYQALVAEILQSDTERWAGP